MKQKMFDTSSLTILAVVVFSTLVLYVVERYTKQKAIDTMDAIKLGALSAVLTSGVLYTVGDTEVAAVVETAQDMFVGKPSF